jgi:hypothetical protein
MAQYKWTRKSNRATATFGEVELVAAAAMGAKPILEGAGSCSHEDAAAEVGMAILMRGGAAITEWKPGDAQKFMVVPQTDWDRRQQALLNQVCDAVFEQFEFEAWR